MRSGRDHHQIERTGRDRNGRTWSSWVVSLEKFGYVTYMWFDGRTCDSILAVRGQKIEFADPETLRWEETRDDTKQPAIDLPTRVLGKCRMCHDMRKQRAERL